eukprot:TRINITY_DN28913_c0_g1_i1.p1 TRINITY_DN28913_c0_g1~~TRINITY_DN28913_c0_g1_i1.p1  ORF type:complete len:389 (-),score=25.43 TRINITY_DN28913_c0_g1_i1:438-1604(-)
MAETLRRRPNSGEESVESSSSPEKQESSCCRICHAGDGKLLSPCACKGSLQYVHESCLWEWRSSRPETAENSADRCELCGVLYSVPGPMRIGFFRRLSLIFCIAALLSLAYGIEDSIREVLAWKTPAAFHTGGTRFTKPWRRAMAELFKAADLDNDGGMSLSEMRAMANKTGEAVTDQQLQLVVRVVDKTERGLTVEGLLQTYSVGNEQVLLADLETYGLLHTLQVVDEDVSSWGLAIATLVVLAVVFRILLMIMGGCVVTLDCVAAWFLSLAFSLSFSASLFYSAAAADALGASWFVLEGPHVPTAEDVVEETTGGEPRPPAAQSARAARHTRSVEDLGIGAVWLGSGDVYQACRYITGYRHPMLRLQVESVALTCLGSLILAVSWY